MVCDVDFKVNLCIIALITQALFYIPQHGASIYV